MSKVATTIGPFVVEKVEFASISIQGFGECFNPTVIVPVKLLEKYAPRLAEFKPKISFERYNKLKDSWIALGEESTTLRQELNNLNQEMHTRSYSNESPKVKQKRMVIDSLNNLLPEADPYIFHRDEPAITETYGDVTAYIVKKCHIFFHYDNEAHSKTLPLDMLDEVTPRLLSFKVDTTVPEDPELVRIKDRCREIEARLKAIHEEGKILDFLFDGARKTLCDGLKKELQEFWDNLVKEEGVNE
jgi:hypothetical protein